MANQFAGKAFVGKAFLGKAFVGKAFAAADTGTSTTSVIEEAVVKQDLGVETIAAPQAKNKYRDVHLQGLRGLAMGLVFLGHFTGAYLLIPGEHASWIRLLQYISTAQFGSTTFLTIAGFVLYERVRRSDDFHWKPYLKARLLRIIPLYWLALTVKAAWELSVGRHRIPADNVDAAVYLLQNALLLFPFTKAPAFITVSWTIAYLFIGYLSVPAIAQAVKRWNFGFRGRIATLVVFAAFWIAVPMFWTRLGWNGFGLAMGMLISEVHRKWPVRSWAANLLDLAAPVVLICACAFFLGLQNGSIVFPARQITFLLFILVASLPVCMVIAGRLANDGLLNRLLATKFFVWLGDVSFAFYLFHGLALLAFKSLLRFSETKALLAGQSGYLLGLLLCYGLALAAAVGIHYFVELPMSVALGQAPGWGERWLSHIKRPRQASPSKPSLSSRSVLAK